MLTLHFHYQFTNYVSTENQAKIIFGPKHAEGIGSSVYLLFFLFQSVADVFATLFYLYKDCELLCIIDIKMYYVACSFFMHYWKHTCFCLI